MDTLLSTIQSTEDRISCNYALWCFSTQRLLRSHVETKIHLIVPAIASCIDGRFDWNVIKSQALDAILKLFKSAPKIVVLCCEDWLLKVILMTASAQQNLRTLSEEILNVFVQSTIHDDFSMKDDVVIVWAIFILCQLKTHPLVGIL